MALLTDTLAFNNTDFKEQSMNPYSAFWLLAVTHIGCIHIDYPLILKQIGFELAVDQERDKE